MSVDRVTLLAVACAFVLAACGGGSDAPAGSGTAETPTTANAAAPVTQADAPAAGFALLPGVSAAEQQALGIQSPFKTVRFRDAEGEGLLVLGRTNQQREDADSGSATDVATLTATLYARATPEAPFAVRWASESATECEGLDLEAGYFLDQTGVADVDGDGVAEATLASHSFCGGGVDPQQIVIELRRGNDVYRVDGESLVTVEGDEPFGGERQDSASYKDAPPALQKHLDAVWEAVYSRPVGGAATP